MQEKKLDEQWWHTASIICAIHNSQVTKRQHAKTPAHFHPTERRRARRACRVSAREGIQQLTNALMAEFKHH
jgi:hypothetical protein